LGADLVYASRVEGRFHLHRAAAATQWLRAERMALEGVPYVHAVGLHEAGPNLRWVTVEQEDEGRLKVVPWTGFNASKSLATGWTLCLDAPRCEGATLEIRTSTGALAAQSQDPCLALDGLHMEDVWKVTLAGCLDNTATATAVLRDPEGTEVRRYGLSAEGGWTFTMLPLDLLAGLLNRAASDGSEWPRSTSMWVHFDHATSDLTPEALEALDGWVKALGEVSGKGHWHVTGHTDASGTPAINKTLSQARAEVVAIWLQTHLGLASASVEVRGMGGGAPCCEDDGLNRRVEVLWVPSLQ
jgi:outer membrane protein OmpA-like peptidoglycan-associated protein